MIYATGDLHGNALRFQPQYFPVQAKMTKDDFVIVCGDFGCIWNGDKSDDPQLDRLESLPVSYTHLDVYKRQGAWAAGAMVIPDLTRFIKTPKAVAISVPASFLVGAIPPICGVILGATLGESLDAVLSLIHICSPRARIQENGFTKCHCVIFNRKNCRESALVPVDYHDCCNQSNDEEEWHCDPAYLGHNFHAKNCTYHHDCAYNA